MSFRRVLITILLSLSIVLAVGAVAYAAGPFDINKGIVGNLSPACREQGDCGWCDFIDLFVILQKTILYLFGGLALVALVWGGQGIILAAGNEEKITAGKKIITSTLLGVLIILGAYMLVNIILTILVKPTNKNIGTPTWFSNWQQAYCGDTSSENWCANRADGTACKSNTVLDGTTWFVCQSGECNTKQGERKTLCSQEITNGTCRKNTDCGKAAVKAMPFIPQDVCTKENNCAIGLCAGRFDMVCCNSEN